MKNFFKGGILLAILVLGILAWYVYQPLASLEEGENVFTSSTFADYRTQMRAFLHAHPSYEKIVKGSSYGFNGILQDLLREVDGPLGDASAARFSHEVFVFHLRELAAERLLEKSIDERERDSYALLDDLVRWIFLKADLRPSMEKFLYTFVSPPEGDLLEYLPKALNSLKENPHFDGIHFGSSHEDGYLHGNLPSIQFKKEGGIEVIRLALPLSTPPFYPRFWSSPKVHPEFLLFLHLQRGHFYVNLMKRKGMEASATALIEHLEDLLPSLYVITLDKNSPFYWQEGEEYLEAMDKGAFKDLFLERLTEENGEYFWSHHIDSATWKASLKTILDGTTDRFFRNQDHLNRTERQDLIDLTYVAILNHLMDLWHPPSVNITCKQAIDRGPSLSILLMRAETSSPNPRQTAALLLAPPLLIHNRPSHISKIDRFISAARRIQLSRSPDEYLKNN